MIGREAHAAGDRRRAAVAVAVEHLDRHDRRAVGEAGQRDPVVRALGDRRRHVRAVAVDVLGVRIVVDEVPARDEARVVQVGRVATARSVRIRGTGVEDRDHDAAAARAPSGDQIRPRGRRVDAERAGEVPLHLGPAAGRRSATGIVGDEVGDMGAHVRDGVLDVGPLAQPVQRLADVLHPEHARVVERRRHGARMEARRPRPVAHDDARTVGGGRGGQQAGKCREDECEAHEAWADPAWTAQATIHGGSPRIVRWRLRCPCYNGQPP